MVKNIYLLLGLPEGAPWSEVKVAYAKFMENLCSADDGEVSESSRAMKDARKHLGEAWEHMKKPEVSSIYRQQTPSQSESQSALPADFSRPKLGQLLVASGIVTLEELDSLLEIQ